MFEWLRNKPAHPELHIDPKSPYKTVLARCNSLPVNKPTEADWTETGVNMHGVFTQTDSGWIFTAREVLPERKSWLPGLRFFPYYRETTLSSSKNEQGQTLITATDSKVTSRGSGLGARYALTEQTPAWNIFTEALRDKSAGSSDVFIALTALARVVLTDIAQSDPQGPEQIAVLPPNLIADTYHQQLVRLINYNHPSSPASEYGYIL